MFNETSIMDLYIRVHGWLSCFICMIGLAFNCLNIIILGRTQIEPMVKKTNFILMTMASSDSILMASYFIFSMYTYIFKTKTERERGDQSGDEFWSILSICHMILSLTFHSISIWLTVYLALFRYVFISKSNQSNKTFLVEKCHINVLVIVIGCLLICLPVYSYPVFKYSINLNETFMGINKTDLDQLVFNSIFYTQGFLVKIIPCCLLVTFISLLIRQLIIINKNQKKLIQVNLIV